MQRWFSGRILACHAGGPGSIPGRCKLFDFDKWKYQILIRLHSGPIVWSTFCQCIIKRIIRNRIFLSCWDRKVNREFSQNGQFFRLNFYVIVDVTLTCAFGAEEPLCLSSRGRALTKTESLRPGLWSSVISSSASLEFPATADKADAIQEVEPKKWWILEQIDCFFLRETENYRSTKKIVGRQYPVPQNS